MISKSTGERCRAFFFFKPQWCGHLKKKKKYKCRLHSWQGVSKQRKYGILWSDHNKGTVLATTAFKKSKHPGKF